LPVGCKRSQRDHSHDLTHHVEQRACCREHLAYVIHVREGVLNADDRVVQFRLAGIDVPLNLGKLNILKLGDPGLKPAG
jgi:hypothetical protein